MVVDGVQLTNWSLPAIFVRTRVALLTDRRRRNTTLALHRAPAPLIIIESLRKET